MQQGLRRILLKASIGAVAGGLSALVVAFAFPSVLGGSSTFELVGAGILGGFVAALAQVLLETLLRI